MFQYDVTSERDFSSKRDRQETYFEFLKQIGQTSLDFPFFYQDGLNKLRKPRIYTVVSWGGYEAADGNWYVFISYRAPSPDATVVHRWLWDEENGNAYGYAVQKWCQ